MRRRIPQPTSAVDRLAEVGPLPLDGADVAEVGPVRAAFDAVSAHPLDKQAFEEARGDSAAMLRYAAVSALLARRTAEEAAAATAPF